MVRAPCPKREEKCNKKVKFSFFIILQDLFGLFNFACFPFNQWPVVNQVSFRILRTLFIFIWQNLTNEVCKKDMQKNKLDIKM